MGRHPHGLWPTTSVVGAVDHAYTYTVKAIDLRPCPFCANDRLTIVYADGGRAMAVKCDECGAVGPQATNSDPPGHAETKWNLRFGAGVEH